MVGSTRPAAGFHHGRFVRLVSDVFMVATIVCAVANAFIAVADYMKAKFVLANSAEVGLQPAALPYLATLKLAGAVGLVAGLVGFRWLGLTAGIGLIAFFIGAVIAHVRAHVLCSIALPGLYLLLAAVATAHFAGQA